MALLLVMAQARVLTPKLMLWEDWLKVRCLKPVRESAAVQFERPGEEAWQEGGKGPKTEGEGPKLHQQIIKKGSGDLLGTLKGPGQAKGPKKVAAESP